MTLPQSQPILPEDIPPNPLKPLWSTDRVAEYFGVEKSTVLRWITDEQEHPGTGMQARKINNRWKVTQEEVARYRNDKYARGAAS